VSRAGQHLRYVGTGQNRKRSASGEEQVDLRRLAHRLGVECPRVVWAFEMQRATKDLKANLTHAQQPTLGPM